jgi:hypothetical protein
MNYDQKIKDTKHKQEREGRKRNLKMQLLQF